MLPECRIQRIRVLSLSGSAYLYDILRKPDQDELRASTGLTFVALQECVRVSKECWYVSHAETDDPVALFGVGESVLFKDVGIPWMVGTDLIQKFPRRFMKISNRVIKKWLTKYNVLQNYVDSRNEVHVAWLKHMGFTFDGQFDINGVPFFYFYKETNHV